ncbi:NAD-dependent deacetylase [Marmoricola sp. Leaf446]|uniref:NAD-dependent protein deacetylase n=1 Tax=Marmoricola sp. Leaf446 TaxID=1736379 RepID=UPI0006FE6A19|nr:NAD-dependent protein deacetylase [Marmoricola sp. Leaf446]KQT94020.1 NAD-dependent deacetylase [Marmoricola sp. Leaf446]
MADHAPPPAELLDLLGPRTVVLTGAGLSTDSGIPDYRGPGAPARRPMTYQEFVATPASQQRYWARAHVGWSRMGSAEPNAGHRALVRLEAAGRVPLLITQNVDGLHERAGQQQLVALHGRVSKVVCLDCGRTSDRAPLQRRLTELNPGWAEAHADVAARPDGDVALEETHDFVVPGCEACGGRLKPHVVFFGENVPKDRVARCYAAVDDADSLLVVGSSLTVMSGLRFVRHAAKAGTPVVLVNRGATRGDDLATLKLETGCSGWLSDLADAAEQERGALRPA